MDKSARFVVRGEHLFVVGALIFDGGEQISWVVTLKSLLMNRVFCSIIRMLHKVRSIFLKGCWVDTVAESDLIFFNGYVAPTSWLNISATKAHWRQLS